MAVKGEVRGGTWRGVVFLVLVVGLVVPSPTAAVGQSYEVERLDVFSAADGPEGWDAARLDGSSTPDRQAFVMVDAARLAGAFQARAGKAAGDMSAVQLGLPRAVRCWR